MKFLLTTTGKIDCSFEDIKSAIYSFVSVSVAEWWLFSDWGKYFLYIRLYSSSLAIEAVILSKIYVINDVIYSDYRETIQKTE